MDYFPPAREPQTEAPRAPAHKKRARIRRLVFERLEARVPLAADLSFTTSETVGPLLDAGLTSIQVAPPIITFPENGSFRAEVRNNTAPNSSAKIGDQLSLRISAGDPAANNFMLGQRIAINIMFDSNVVNSDGGINHAGNLAAWADDVASAANQRTYFVQRLPGEMIAEGELLLEVPFRVVAAGEIEFTATLAPVKVIPVVASWGGAAEGMRLSNSWHLSSIDLSFAVESSVGHGSLGSDRISDGYQHSPVRSISRVVESQDVVKVDTRGTIDFPSRPIAPSPPPIDRDPPAPPDYDDPPFDNERANLTRFAASDSESDTSREGESWVLSSDAFWNRHRTLLVGGESGARSSDPSRTIPLRTTSRLFTDAAAPESDSESLVNQPADALGRKVRLKGSKGWNLFLSLSSTESFLEFGGEESSHSENIVILNPEDFDEVLAAWREQVAAKESAEKPDRTRE